MRIFPEEASAMTVQIVLADTVAAPSPPATNAAIIQIFWIFISSIFQIKNLSLVRMYECHIH
jgi:hypothetical protein